MLAYRRHAGADQRVVAVNFREMAAPAVGLPDGRWEVEVGTHPPPAATWVEGSMRLRGDEAVVLRPMAKMVTSTSES